jgi:hypothetical protein
MGIIGALYERGAAARVSEKIPRGRRQWNPTLQKTKGGAHGSAQDDNLDGFSAY